MINKEIRDFKYGVINAIEPSEIPNGSMSASLNMLTMGDRIEMRRGSKIMGTDQSTGAQVAGLGVATKLDASGTQVLFRKRTGTQKFEYYDEVTSDWLETGTNAANEASNNDDFAFDFYDSQTGAQAFWSSPNSSIYKIMVANPGSITDLLSTIYRGYIRIKQSRMFLWNRKAASGSGANDEQNPYLSYIDNRQFTTVTAEATTSLLGTLAFKAGGSKRTCFGVKITLTGSGEVFVDNRDGTLTGSLGNTGTINYTTGDYTLSIAGVGTCDYQWEDSTNQGIADFSFSGTRTAGQGNVFLQGDGGPLKSIETYGEVEYCGHAFKTYALQNGIDDTQATNLIFRDREGIPNWRAMKGTSIGIFYVNAIDVANPKIKLLTLQRGSTAVDGVVISNNIDLSAYLFDKCEVKEFEDFVMFSCRTTDSSYNNRFVIYNKNWKSFDIIDYWTLVTAIYNGALVGGESITGNVVRLFSGIDDDDAAIDAHCELNEWDLEYPGFLKTCKYLELEGNIGPDQVFDVKVAVDKGAFVTIGQIKGSGTYVDKTQSVDVGAFTLGRGEVAGGTPQTSLGITAYHYWRKIPLRVGRFERVKVRLERGVDADNNNADGIGYYSLSTLRYRDIRVKANKIPRKYRDET